MCGGVSFNADNKPRKVFFPVPGASLPVVTRDQDIAMLVWGRRKEEPGNLPAGGWARHESILSGKWNWYQPVPVKIAVESFMEKDHAKQSHWFELNAGEFIQGLVARQGDESRVYVVTVEPEDQAIHDRWPRIVTNQQ